VRADHGLVPEARAVIAASTSRDSQAYHMIRAMSWGTSLLPSLVGVLGVMNTMLMTIFERTQADLRASSPSAGTAAGSSAWFCGIGVARVSRRSGRSADRRGRCEAPCHDAGHPRIARAAVEPAASRHGRGPRVVVGVFQRHLSRLAESRLTPSHAYTADIRLTHMNHSA